jgi:nitrite reductase/ring-hydroxylating ferredoxin subunit
VVSPLSFTRAPSCIDFKKKNSRTLTLYATQQSQSFANSTAAWSLRAMSLAICVTAFRDPKPLSTHTAVRLSTAALTYVDFAPIMDIQLRNTTLALATNNSTQTQKYQQLVRLKLAGELLGLAIMLRWACLGAASILSSHVLFWILGAGSTRVDADGNLAPVPSPLVRMICSADMIVGAVALVGALGPSRGLRTAGAALYSILVSALCVRKLRQKAKSQTLQMKTNATATTGKVATETQLDHLESKDEDLRTFTNDSSSSPWKYDWRSNWYPVAFAKATSKTIPHRLELFGEHFVLWHNGTQWAALADSCPHRLAPLSEGRIDEVGQIECPYHGWTFNAEGSCTKIPQATKNQNLASCSARSYRVVEQQGIIFVWGDVGASEDEAAGKCLG